MQTIDSTQELVTKERLPAGLLVGALLTSICSAPTDSSELSSDLALTSEHRSLSGCDDAGCSA